MYWFPFITDQSAVCPNAFMFVDPGNIRKVFPGEQPEAFCGADVLDVHGQYDHRGGHKLGVFAQRNALAEMISVYLWMKEIALLLVTYLVDVLERRCEPRRGYH